MPEEKIYVLTPSRGLTRIEWASSLTKLSKQPITLIYDTRSTLETSRNTLVQRALDEGATRIFFLDDDVLVPQYGLDKLIEVQDHYMNMSEKTKQGFPRHGCVVSGLYYLEWGQPAAGHHTQTGSTPVEVSKDKSTIPCDVVGGGCLLIHPSILPHMKFPWFKFLRMTINNVPVKIGEDHYFCINCEESIGIQPLLCSDVSCEHIISTARMRNGKLVNE